MNIWEKLKENPEDFKLVKGDSFQEKLARLRWKYSPEAAESLMRFAQTGDGQELCQLFKEYRQEEAEDFERVGQKSPINAYVLAGMVHLKSEEQLLWMGCEYLRKASPLYHPSGQKALGCFRKLLKAGQWKSVYETGFSLIGEGRFSEGAMLLEALWEAEGRSMDPESAKKICRTLGLLYLKRKVNPGGAEKGEQWLKRSIEAYEDENAAYTLGMIYREGKALYTDREEALKYLTYAAERGHAEAGLFLVRGLLDGDPVLGRLNIEVKKVIGYLSPAAGNLNPEAIYYAGVLNCTSGDLATAAEMMENVKLEKPEAYGILGQIYFLQRKYKEAWPYLNTAWEKGVRTTIEELVNPALPDNDENRFPWISDCLGRYYACGLAGCCAVDKEKAGAYYEDALKRGHPTSPVYYFAAERLLARELFGQQEQEILDGWERGLLYWEKAVLYSQNGAFLPPPKTGLRLYLLKLKRPSLGDLLYRTKKHLEEYAYREYQIYQKSGDKYIKSPEGGRLVFEYAQYIMKCAREETNPAVRNKIGNEMSGYLSLAAETGIVEACYEMARICIWNQWTDKAYAYCKKGADGGDQACQRMLKDFKKKLLGGYTYKYS